MSADPNTRAAAEDLQFDRAIAPGLETSGPVCSKCSAAIRMYYYNVDGETTCSSCKGAVDRAQGGGAGRRPSMLKAFVYGLGAAIAGAVIYYAVMEYMNLEIGIVAILIGFMVGYAIRNATMGHGSRRFQILAAGLTYFAVALAYAPFALREVRDAADAEADSSAVTASTGADADADDVVAASDASGDEIDAAATDGDVDAASLSPGRIGAGLALGFVGAILFVLALPVMVILGSMPSGLISGVIIGFGMHQAWNMTRGVQATITGPFKVGSDPASAAA